MKKISVVSNLVLAVVLFTVSPAFAAMNEGSAEKKMAPVLYFGDYSSSFLVQKAWASFSEKDFNTAARYAQKTLELYAAPARKMQATLTAYPSGSPEDVFKFWALNDVGTALFILGESYRSAGQKEDALKAFQQIMDEFSYAQCWDQRGWFWKPAEVAKNKVEMANAGVELDFGDYASNSLVDKAWKASTAKDLKSVILYVNKIEELYGAQAKEMQASLRQYADTARKDKQKAFNYWALNDVGTAVFCLAETYRKAGYKKEADELYRRVIKEYYYAQCWNRQGWFWKPAEVAQNRLDRKRLRPEEK